MATDTPRASVITLHPARPKTPAERSKAYRDRQRAKAGIIAPVKLSALVKTPAPVQPVAPVTPVTRRHAVTPSNRTAKINMGSALLAVAAFTPAAVGGPKNGRFARPVVSSDNAGG